MDTPTDRAKYPICRHIKTNGRRCQSPAVHNRSLCHFHRTLHDAHTKGFPPPNALGFMPVQHIEKMLRYGEPLAELARAFPCPTRMTLPPLEDAESVQVAISLIFSDMASGHLNHERAKQLLYALQLASYNFRTLAMVQSRETNVAPMARHVVHTAQGNTLAARDEDSDPPPILDPKDDPKDDAKDPEHPCAEAPDQPTDQPAGQPEASQLPVVSPELTVPDRAALADPSDPEESAIDESAIEPADLPILSEAPPVWQTQQNEDFGCNSNAMTILASAPSPKPTLSLHLSHDPLTEGGGGTPQPHANTPILPTPNPAEIRPPQECLPSHPPKVADHPAHHPVPASRTPAPANPPKCVVSCRKMAVRGVFGGQFEMDLLASREPK